jgi:hypothetical protein
MSDRLLEAVSALRQSATGEELAIGRYTRSRVLSAVRLQKRRRVLNIAFGIPLAAIVVGSGAWAAAGQTFPQLVQRVSVAFGLRERTPASAPISLPSAATRKSAASTPSLPDAPALAPQLPAQVATPELPREVTEAAKPSASPGASAKPAATMPRDSRLTEQELRLYESAHRAHFVDKNAKAALVAWSEYLRQMPRGRFGVEAHYNRALCLVRLGRSAQARQELQQFADGAFGDYRKAEAAALLEQLSAAAP